MSPGPLGTTIFEKKTYESWANSGSGWKYGLRLVYKHL